MVISRSLSDMYPVLCNITADTEAVAKLLKLQRRADGKTFFKLEYDIILLFGRTKLKAQIAWEEGVSKLSGFRNSEFG